MESSIQQGDMGDDTSIRVSEELADELYERKGRGKSYEDYIWELLEKADSGGESSSRAPREKPEFDKSKELVKALDEREEEDDLRSRMEERLDEIHIKGRASAVEATRREALIYAWERLRQEGEMQPRRLADDVLGQYFDDPDLNYSVTASGGHPGYQLLDNFLRETMLELPGVYSTGKKWQFREENDE